MYTHSLFLFLSLSFSLSNTHTHTHTHVCRYATKQWLNHYARDDETPAFKKKKEKLFQFFEENKDTIQYRKKKFLSETIGCWFLKRENLLFLVHTHIQHTFQILGKNQKYTCMHVYLCLRICVCVDDQKNLQIHPNEMTRHSTLFDRKSGGGG
jgi:hypothetical protein